MRYAAPVTAKRKIVTATARGFREEVDKELRRLPRSQYAVEHIDPNRITALKAGKTLVTTRIVARSQL